MTRRRRRERKRRNDKSKWCEARTWSSKKGREEKETKVVDKN